MLKTSELKGLTPAQREQLRELTEAECETIRGLIGSKSGLTGREKLQYSARLYDLHTLAIILDPRGGLAGDDLVGEVDRLRQQLAAAERERDTAQQRATALEETLRDAMGSG